MTAEGGNSGSNGSGHPQAQASDDDAPPSPSSSSPSERVLMVGLGDTQFADNAVYTTKYTPWNFLPMNLGQQMRRVANLWFLIIGIVMAIGFYNPSLFESPVTPWPTLVPLIIVVSLSIVQEGLADLNRHRCDAKQNATKVTIVTRDGLGEDDDDDDEEDGDIEVGGGETTEGGGGAQHDVHHHGRTRFVTVHVPRRKAVPVVRPPDPADSHLHTATTAAAEVVALMDEEQGQLLETTTSPPSPPPQIKRVTTTTTTRTTSKRTRPVHLRLKAMEMHAIRAGHLVLVKNRDVIPADLVLLASSADGGGAYVETSSIDGETNLKARASAKPQPRHTDKSDSNTADATATGGTDNNTNDRSEETLEQALARLCTYSILGEPDGVSVLEYERYRRDSSLQRRTSLKSTHSSRSRRRLISPDATGSGRDFTLTSGSRRQNEKFVVRARHSIFQALGGSSAMLMSPAMREIMAADIKYVAALTAELPNASVHTFTGKMSVPSLDNLEPPVHVPLSADNLLLRGAVLRNTEWAIGVAVYTGEDTKLVRNSSNTASKFSRLEQIVNTTMLSAIASVLVIVAALAGQSLSQSNRFFDDLWYLGLNRETELPWPYLPDFDAPQWVEEERGYFFFFFVYLALLNQFVPLSMYISLEVMTYAFIKYVEMDLTMYHPETDTPAQARNTNITDLGQVQYVFSDKTGTLTQNVMKLKRCSVDGKIFGAPIVKASPGQATDDADERAAGVDGGDPDGSFSALHDLSTPPGGASVSRNPQAAESSHQPTFNGEMFLRVMSICHTVVVEKDEGGGGGTAMSDDGAPPGHIFQAESPDEGALVSAASTVFGYQFINRDATTIRVSCPSTSVLKNEEWVNGLKDGTLTAMTLDARSRRVEDSPHTEGGSDTQHVSPPVSVQEEWELLAVNKFDSDRKRMSVVVRSPPSMGSIPLLLCKGADSSMLDEDVCQGGEVLRVENHRKMESRLTQCSDCPALEEESGSAFADQQGEHQLATLLGLEHHLGVFASEGLRTLVLGIRILSEDQCQTWLSRFRTAQTSMVGRDLALKEAAKDIEKDIHIVGATAIEDKLQDGVPETIAKLADAGIKLWVLTGDKRETAVEIGYSTKVLTPNMQIFQVAAGSEAEVQTLVAAEFLGLVKKGTLRPYQRTVLGESDFFHRMLATLRKWRVSIRYRLRRIGHSIKVCCTRGKSVPARNEDAEGENDSETKILTPREKRMNVRLEAEKILRSGGVNKRGEVEQLDMKERSKVYDAIGINPLSWRENGTIALPLVFSRSISALRVLQAFQSQGRLKDVSSSFPHATDIDGCTLEHSADDGDILSMESVSPKEAESVFSKGPTVLERLFSVDPDVRNGKLAKNVQLSETCRPAKNEDDAVVGLPSPRALVIEGAALAHFLGDPILEEMLFGVASCCESVIACRVSPKQKALLVKLVCDHVSPTPVSLAIGDGANDVGMIQQAHIGVGISGLEGQQAVNSSDFAIAQFRYLLDLLLVHGRWDYHRMAKMILLTFYTNVVMCGLLVAYGSMCLYGGTPVFTGWYIALVNAVVRVPTIFMGFFDRDIHRQYSLRNPAVYSLGQNNEVINPRTKLRWLTLIVVHICVIYSISLFATLAGGSSYTSAFTGLMHNENRGRPGDGEAGDLRAFGQTVYVVMTITFLCKVMIETQTYVHGECPWFSCRKDEGGWLSRLPWTWIGIVFGSVGLVLFVMYFLQTVGEQGVGNFSMLAGVSSLILERRSLTWMLLLLVPATATSIDVIGKVFGDMFYPSQTQIHREIAHGELGNRNKRTSNKGRDRF